MTTFVRIVLGLLAVVLTALFLASNIAFAASRYASEPFDFAFWTGVACCTAGVKLTLPFGLRLISSRAWKWAGLVVLAACIGFDVLGALGYYKATSGAKAGGRQNAVDMYNASKANVGRLRAAADAYKGGRTPAEVEAELRGARRDAGRCLTASEKCDRVTRLETELARVNEAEARELAWSSAADAFAKLKAPAAKSADPLASIVVEIARHVWAGAPDTLADMILSGLLIVLSEVAAPTLAYVALNARSLPVTPQPSTPPNAPAAPPLAAQPRRMPARVKGRPASAGAALDELRAIRDGSRSAHGVTVTAGIISGSLRALGKAVGVASPSTVSRMLGELQASGQIVMTTGPNGTAIEIK